MITTLFTWFGEEIQELRDAGIVLYFTDYDKDDSKISLQWNADDNTYRLAVHYRAKCNNCWKSSGGLITIIITKDMADKIIALYTEGHDGGKN